MKKILITTSIAIFLALSCASSFAKKPKTLWQNSITGISDTDIAQNVEKAINSETKEIKKPTQDELEKFQQSVPKIVRNATAPFGYFNPQVKTALSQKQNSVYGNYQINLGQATKIKSIDLKIISEGRKNHKLKKLIKHFPIKANTILNTEKYEEAKHKLFNSLTNRGYVKAKIETSKILVDREKNSANIILHIETHAKYKFGKISFSKTPFSDGFLQRFIPFKQDDYYSNKKLQNLQDNLNNSNYFKQVSITPEVDQAKNLTVPISAHLVPKNSRQYTIGAGYGTDTGPRGILGMELRHLTKNGQYARGFIRGSDVDADAEFHYLIPGHNPVTDQYDLSLAGNVSQEKFGDTKSASISTGYTTTVLDGWKQTMRLSLQHESDKPTGATEFTSTNFLIPSINWLKTKTNHPIRTTKGWKINLNLQGSPKIFGSKTNFVQGRIDAKFIEPFFDYRTLLVLRGTYALTAMNDLDELPLSLQYYTGGAQTIRGYGYNSIGPGRNMVIGSVELRQRIYDHVYLAAFGDTGNVTNSFNMTLKKAFGAGVVWLSPIGTMELSIAQAQDTPGKPKMIQFSMGPEF